MRPAALRPLALVAMLLCLGACGDDPSSIIRVEILTADADGPVDVPVALLSAGPDRTRYPLRPVAGGGPGLMETEAPSGHYFVYCDAGWDQLRVKPDAFEFQAGTDIAPQSVYVGKAGTFYVSMRDQDKPSVGLEWALERETADGARTPIPCTTFPAFEQVVGIRPPASEWHGRIRLTGKRVDGRMLNPIPVELGTPGPERPRVRLMITAPVVEFGVRLVAPAGGKGVPEGYPVRVSVLGIPLEEAHEARAKDAVAAFAAVTRMPEGLRVTAGPTRHDLDSEFLAARGVVHLLSLEEETQALTTLTWSGSASIDEVRVRPKGRRQYALAELVPVDGAPPSRVRVRTCAGPQRWLVRSGTRWQTVEIDDLDPRADARIVTLADDKWVDGANATGEILDARGGKPGPFPPGHRLLFVRTEGKEQVLGEGFDFSIPAQGRYKLHLPPGTYQVSVQGPRGLIGKPAPLELTPGVSLRRSFEVE